MPRRNDNEECRLEADLLIWVFKTFRYFGKEPFNGWNDGWVSPPHYEDEAYEQQFRKWPPAGLEHNQPHRPYKLQKALNHTMAILREFTNKHKPCHTLSVENQGCCGVCGDIDGDGEVTILDIEQLIAVILTSQPGDIASPCLDTYNDGQINVNDIVKMVDTVLGGDPFTCPPCEDDPCAPPNVCTGEAGTDATGNWLLDPGACTCFPWEAGCTDIWLGPYPPECTLPVWPDLDDIGAGCMYFCAEDWGVGGCTDVSACNYNAAATYDDGSCNYGDVCGICGGTVTDDWDCCPYYDNPSDCENLGPEPGYCQWDGECMEGGGKRGGSVNKIRGGRY